MNISEIKGKHEWNKKEEAYRFLQKVGSCYLRHNFEIIKLGPCAEVTVTKLGFVARSFHPDSVSVMS